MSSSKFSSADTSFSFKLNNKNNNKEKNSKLITGNYS